MNAAKTLDEILEEGLEALDLRWNDPPSLDEGSGTIALPLPAGGSDESNTGIRRVLTPQTHGVPTWDDVTTADVCLLGYAHWFEEGMRAGIRDVTEYRYRIVPNPKYFVTVAYHQKQAELSGENLQKYVDGFVEGAISRLTRRRRWVRKPSLPPARASRR